ncbi:ABC transporter substrate-binding protein [Methylobacterium terricola]|nr:ABC transporter substrate-binding protein [Methylobacterium terricola]
MTRLRMRGITRRIAAPLLAAGLVALASASRAHAADTKPVTIAIQYGYAYLPVVVAEKLGFFERQLAAAGASGRTVAIQKISGAPAINDALISGTVDIGAYGLPGMLIAAEKTRGSLNVRGLAALVAGDNGLYVNRADITSMADFKPDDRIAVTSTTGQQGLLVRMAAEKAFGEGGARRFDRMMVQLPHPDATASLLAGGTIVGYAAPHPYSDIVEKSGKAHRLFYFSDYLGEKVTSGLLATTGAFMKTNEAAARGVVAAIAEAQDYIRKEPRKAAEIFLASEKSSLSLDEIEAVLKAASGEWGIQPQGVMRFATFMARNGLLKAAPAKWQDVFVGPVVDGSGT